MPHASYVIVTYFLIAIIISTLVHVTAQSVTRKKVSTEPRQNIAKILDNRGFLATCWLFFFSNRNSTSVRAKVKSVRARSIGKLRGAMQGIAQALHVKGNGV